MCLGLHKKIILINWIRNLLNLYFINENLIEKEIKIKYWKITFLRKIY